MILYGLSKLHKPNIEIRPVDIYLHHTILINFLFKKKIVIKIH